MTILSKRQQALIARGDFTALRSTKKPRKAKHRSGPQRLTWLKKSAKKIPVVNKARQAKKLAAYKAFMCSNTWAEIRAAAIERAGRRCEYTVHTQTPTGGRSVARCPMTRTLTVHHQSYSRFGGRELPRDLQVLCRAHHDAVEALKGGSHLWQRGKAS